MIGHFEEKNGYKYLILDDVNENKEVSKKYEEIWDGIKKEIKTLNNSKKIENGKGFKKIENGKGFKKIRFKSNDYLPPNKPIKLHLLTIIIRSVFIEKGKFYPQLFLDDALYEFIKMLQYQKINVSEGVDVNKTSESKECTIGFFLKILNSNLKNMFVMDVMIY